MKIVEIIFIASLAITFYSYVGYGLVLYLLVLVKRLSAKKQEVNTRKFEPEVTMLVAAYNEQDYVAQKVKNSQNLDYPEHKIKHVWVTDGSNDNTTELLQGFEGVEVLHKPERNGKIAAINRAMGWVDTPIVIFSDANTMLNKQAVRNIVKHFRDDNTGCVSGEKRIQASDADTAASGGEGMYWKYESKLKTWDSELKTTVGAAGELFAIRAELFSPVEADTVLDDFMISMRIAMNGYKIAYAPDAFATENASANVEEELKRKVRIAAGGIQSVLRLLPLLNVFKYRTLSFQYISHRFLRWTLSPIALLTLYVSNAVLSIGNPGYEVFFGLQTLFYAIALLGYFVRNKALRIKAIFVPFYFSVMNFAILKGIYRYAFGSQSVNWERAKRSKG